jgi:nucleoside-diphosphate-sugar epimerase
MGQTALRRILVTGISGNLGRRLAPLLAGYEVVSADLYPPPSGVRAGEFHRVDLSTPDGREILARLVLDSGAEAVLHLAFVVDQVRSGILDRERMRQTNVEGTRRLLEAVAEANASGRATPEEPRIRLLVYLSSVSAYGTGHAPLLSEDAPLAAHSLPYAVDKRETDLLCQQMFLRLGGAALYIFRPHIYAAAATQNWLIDGVRGRASGRGSLARLARRLGWRVPVLLPAEADTSTELQFVHTDDVARTLAWTLAHFRAGALEIFNLAGEGPLALEECARLAGTPVVRVHTERTVRFLLRIFYKLGLSAVPAEALPYYLQPPTMDTRRLRATLGKDYEEVVRYTTRAALEDALQR